MKIGNYHHHHHYYYHYYHHHHRLLNDAMSVTKNQSTFFNIGKFLVPLVLVAWVIGAVNEFNIGSTGSQ